MGRSLPSAVVKVDAIVAGNKTSPPDLSGGEADGGVGGGPTSR